jgi:hypothetical protein
MATVMDRMAVALLLDVINIVEVKEATGSVPLRHMKMDRGLSMDHPSLGTATATDGIQ